jgi:hypothetical protein
MNPINITVTGYNLGGIPGWALMCVIVSLLLWLWSIVAIAKKKTADPFDRVVWLLIVLALNIIGTILYFIFSEDTKAKAYSEEDIKRRANEGTL